MIGDTYIFNPTTIADLHLSFLRWNYKRTPGTLGYDETKLGFPGYFSEIAQYNGFSPSTTVPSISMSNPTYNGVGTGLIFSINNNYVIAPDIYQDHRAPHDQGRRRSSPAGDGILSKQCSRRRLYL